MERLLVLQIEDREDTVTSALMEHNRALAQRHGFRWDGRRVGVPDLPPYWWKVFVLGELCRNHPEVDLLLWLDSDAMLLPMHGRDDGPLSLARRDPHHSMWISGDAPVVGHAPFCAGAFLVRNDAWGRGILEEWRGLYRPDRWTRGPGDDRWHAAGPWAGPDYEQGAFIDHLLPRQQELGRSTKNKILLFL